jgi:hypothetical protein
MRIDKVNRKEFAKIYSDSLLYGMGYYQVEGNTIKHIEVFKRSLVYKFKIILSYYLGILKEYIIRPITHLKVRKSNNL